MKTILSSLFALAVIGSVSVGQAKPPTGSGIVDLAADSITSKTKCKDSAPCTIQNLTLYIDNVGDSDAKKARVDFYLSDDDVLTTDSEGGTTETDTLIHSQAIGTVKVDKLKKRTLGGGLLKQLTPSTGQYVFAVVDSTYVLDEPDELNNILSAPLP